MKLCHLCGDHPRRIATTGGLTGLGFWETACCGRDAAAIAAAMHYAAELAGDDHVGLGSECDGTVTLPLDASGMAQLTDGLLQEGFNGGETYEVLAGNRQEPLPTCLPDSS